VSTFGATPSAVGPDHLQPLFDHVMKYIPPEAAKDTPLFLLATAGMRLLPDSQRNQVMDEICDYARKNTEFMIPDCGLHIQVIPGETEGLYGWIAANYLLGGFDQPEAHNHGKGHHTYGFLDMGGASAQIAFAPNATETEKHFDDLKLLRLRTLSGIEEEYKVFVTTWLGFGATQARQRYLDSLRTTTDPLSLEILDPCLPTGLRLDVHGKPITADWPASVGDAHYLLGTGDFAACLNQTFPLLEKTKPCNDDPCLFGGVHVPSIDFDVNHFVGVSEYWHTTHEIFEMDHNDKAYDFNTYQARVNAFCNQPWDTIAAGVKEHKWGQKVDELVAEEVCFKASWLINVLHEGIGVPRYGLEDVKDTKNTTKSLVSSAQSKGFLDPFHPVDKINSVEVSWTLGKMVLYASSQVPPSAEAEQVLPVGFGSNVDGIPIPTDFQRPAGGGEPAPQPTDWADALFRLDSPRRIPGVLLFLLIVCVAVFLLCGRERRKALASKLRSACGLGRRRRGGAAGARGESSLGKLFGRGAAYERVDSGEAGEALDLDDFDSEDEVGSASGWATPKVRGEGAAETVLSPGKRLVDGLVRADSRDALSVMGLGGRLSRPRSPAARFRKGD
jgi:Golgi nucleoside diphosphatase